MEEKSVTQFVESLYYVFPYLNQQDKFQLASTSKKIYEDLKAYQFVANIVSVIFKNYEIINFQKDDLRELFFKNTRIFLLGETHVNDEDRFLNACLCTFLSRTSNSKLVVEGSEASLKHWKKSSADRGPLTYMPSDLSSSAEVWDVGHLVSEASSYAVKTSATFISQVRKTVRFFKRHPHFLPKTLRHFIQETFGEEFGFRLDETVERRFKKSSIEQKRELRQQIVKSIYEQLLKMFDKNSLETEKQIEAVNDPREMALFEKIKRAQEESQQTFFIAGSQHVLSSELQARLSTLPKRFSPVTLIPSESNTYKEVAKSFRKIGFRTEIPLQSEEDLLISNLNAIVFYNQETITNNEYLYLVESLLRFDVKRLSSSKHHFGLWLEVCRRILQHVVQQGHLQDLEKMEEGE